MLHQRDRAWFLQQSDTSRWGLLQRWLAEHVTEVSFPWHSLGWLSPLLGLVVGAGTVYAVSGLWRLLRGQWGMGFGDVMLMGMIGAYLGPWGVPAVLCGGALLGTVWLLASGRGRLDPGAKLPFGTFLAAAAAPLALWGEPLARWYLGRF